MKFTDEQRAALDRHWKELFEDVVPTETEMVAYGYLYGYFKRGYAAAKNETCKWTTYVDLEGSYWATGCIEVFWEKHNFCPDCGRKIQVVEREKAELESRSREIEAEIASRRSEDA